MAPAYWHPSNVYSLQGLYPPLLKGQDSFMVSFTGVHLGNPQELLCKNAIRYLLDKSTLFPHCTSEIIY